MRCSITTMGTSCASSDSVNANFSRTKLLATEVRISSKLALRMAAGYELSRRENRQVTYLRS
jgi:hypothetical protein